MPSTAELQTTPPAPAPPRARPAPVALSDQEREILEHTVRRAMGGRFCGDSPAMQRLVSLGLMRSLGFTTFCPDEYFTITPAGRAALQQEPVLPMYVVYERPADFPDSVVAVAWHVYSGKAVRGEVIAAAATLEEVRDKLPPGLCRIPRSSEDDAVIVETWL